MLPEFDCIRCYDTRQLAGLLSGSFAFRPLIVCEKCGYKRCPKATDHRNNCTDSNLPGQLGSDYHV